MEGRREESPDPAIAVEPVMLPVDGSWVRVLLATLIMQMINAYLYYVTPVLAPAVTSTANAGEGFVGWLVAIGTVGSIVFMMVGTPIVTGLGSLRSLQLGTAVGGVGALLMGIPSAASMVVGNMLMGLGYGPSSPAGSDILQRFAPARHRNLIFSIRQAGVPLSGLAAGTLLPVLYGWGGWTAVIGSTVALVVLSITVVQPVRRITDASVTNSPPLRWADIANLSNVVLPIRLVQDERLTRLAAAGACLAFGHGCWVAYLVTWLTRVGHLSLVEAGLVFATMQISGVVGRLVLGWLSDMLGSAVRVLQGVSFVSALTSVGIAIGGTMPLEACYLLAAVAGVTVSSWNGIQVAAVAARVPQHRISVCASGATILVFGGFVVGPVAFALVLERTGDFRGCFLMTAFVTFLALPLLLWVRPASPARA